MYKLAYIEDEAINQEMIKDLIDDYSASREDKIQVKLFSNGYDLIEYENGTSMFDIYLVDYIMPDINGFDLSKIIRKNNQNSIIIFFTSSKDIAVDAYDIHAFHYLLKPLNVDKMYQVLDDAVKFLKKNNTESIYLKTKNGELRILLKDIAYIDKENRSLVYHLKNGKAEEGLILRGSFLSEVPKKILDNDNFLVCGLSLIVNVNQIESIGKNCFKMKSGNLVYPPVSSFNELTNKINNL